LSAAGDLRVSGRTWGARAGRTLSGHCLLEMEHGSGAEGRVRGPRGVRKRWGAFGRATLGAVEWWGDDPGSSNSRETGAGAGAEREVGMCGGPGESEVLGEDKAEGFAGADGPWGWGPGVGGWNEEGWRLVGGGSYAPSYVKRRGAEVEAPGRGGVGARILR